MRERRKAPAMPSTAQLLLSDTEVAAILGLGVSTVWKKARDPNDSFPAPLSITERAKRWRRSDIFKWVKDLSNPVQISTQQQ